MPKNSEKENTNNHTETHTSQCKRRRAKPVDLCSLGWLLLQSRFLNALGVEYTYEVSIGKGRTDSFSNTSLGSADRHPPNSQGHARCSRESQRRGERAGGGRARQGRWGRAPRLPAAVLHARAPHWSGAAGFPDDGIRELKQRGPPPARSGRGKLRWRISKEHCRDPSSWP